MPPTARPHPRPTSASERRLILAARRGDATAQTRIFSQYEPMMRLIARRLYLPGGERDDLAQEARIGLLDAMRTWDPERGVPFSNFAWLCATRETRTAVNAARANKHRPLTTAAAFSQAEGPSRDAAMAPDLQAAYEATAPRRERVRVRVSLRLARGDDDPVAKTLAREQLRALLARTRTLTPLERRALAMATSERSHREIADTLHIRVRAVNNALQRARHKVREPEPSAA
jgi:RNA polymerase sigma-H factor